MSGVEETPRTLCTLRRQTALYPVKTPYAVVLSCFSLNGPFSEYIIFHILFGGQLFKKQKEPAAGRLRKKALRPKTLFERNQDSGPEPLKITPVK